MKIVALVSWFWTAVLLWAWMSGAANQAFLLSENKKLLGMSKECADYLGRANDGWGFANTEWKTCNESLVWCLDELHTATKPSGSLDARMELTPQSTEDR